jgi:hypothetical protein
MTLRCISGVALRRISDQPQATLICTVEATLLHTLELVDEVSRALSTDAKLP